MDDARISNLEDRTSDVVVVGLQRITLETSGTPLSTLQRDCYCWLHSMTGKVLELDQVATMLQLRSPLAFYSRLDHLEEKGWIVRQVNPTQGKS